MTLENAINKLLLILNISIVDKVLLGSTEPSIQVGIYIVPSIYQSSSALPLIIAL